MDIHKVCGRLDIHGHMENFANIDHVVDRVIYCEEMVREAKELPSDGKVEELRKDKDDNIAELFRRLGHIAYRCKKYVDALELYNKAICFTENNSPNLCVGYSCRALVYFELKQYQHCFDDIVFAKRQAFCPDELNEKLIRKKNECARILLTEKTPQVQKKIYVPQLSYGFHKKIPFIVDKMEFRESEEFGRHIISNGNLEAGKILAIEEGLCNAVMAEKRYQRCAYCLSECLYRLFPCKGCTNTMYCGVDCYEKALLSYHKYECTIMDYIVAYPIFRNVLRATIDLYLAFDNSDELMAFTENPEEQNLHAFNVDWSRHPPPKRQTYKLLFNSCKNQYKRTMGESFCLSRYAALLYDLLVNFTCFEIYVTREIHKRLLRKVIFHFFLISSTSFRFNMLKSTIAIGTLTRPEPCASSITLVTNMINHSCEPNCRIEFYKNKYHLLYTIRPVKAGEQLFIDYMEKIEDNRKHVLNSRYQLRCKCPDDHSNRQTFESARKRIPYLSFVNETYMFPFYDDEIVLQAYVKFSNYLTQFDEHYPCWELWDVRQSLDITMQRLLGTRWIVNIPIFPDPPEEELDSEPFFTAESSTASNTEQQPESAAAQESEPIPASEAEPKTNPEPTIESIPQSESMLVSESKPPLQESESESQPIESDSVLNPKPTIESKPEPEPMLELEQQPESKPPVQESESELQPTELVSNPEPTAESMSESVDPMAESTEPLVEEMEKLFLL